MPDISGQMEGSQGQQIRQLTIGLGSALDAFAEVDEVNELISDLNALGEERYKERITEILDLYQEQPHLLDPHLPGFLSRLINAILKIGSNTKENDTVRPKCVDEAHSAAFCAQQLVKVRGHKVAVRHFPHEVHHVEAVLAILEMQNAEASENWETRYVLLLWMSMLVLIPFHLARFDTNKVDEMNEKSSSLLKSENIPPKTVIERILLICKKYLVVGNKNQQAACLLSAKFLTRPEIIKLGHLADFLDWIAQKIVSNDSTDFEKTGALMALAAIYKHGKREDILEYAPNILSLLTNSESASRKSKNMQIQKLGIKVIQRLGLTFLKARVATWRYQRGCRSLAMNLGEVTDSKIMKLENSELESSQTDTIDEDYFVPEEIEEIIQELLEGLRSSETIIRWSAAKGIGRITGRLPKDMADDVVESLFEVFSLKESDGAWHGACLAVAELARRGLILPERLSTLVDLTCLAFVYDERKGNFSVGSHVRDAACYVSWSLARAFSPKILAPYLPQLASSLLTVAVFDREVNCRRAASAAFQENIGRQGADCLPNSIDILTTIDYHAVGSRPKCYNTLALKLANYDRSLFGSALIKHLLEKKIGHWDATIRELTAICFGKMAMDSVIHRDIIQTVLPELLDTIEQTRDLYKRHGSLLSIGEIVRGISVHVEVANSSAFENILGGNQIVNRIKVIVSLLEQKMALRGSGGDIIRWAVTKFIHNLSEAHFPAHDDKDTLNLWKMTLDDNLSSTDPKMQEQAVIAVAAYVKEYCSTRKSCDAVIKSYLSNLDGSENHRRGFSLALGSLPHVALKGRLDQILSALIVRCSISDSTSVTSLSPCRDSGTVLLVEDGKKVFGPEQERWAEGRRDVLRAIAKIVKTVGVHLGTQVTDVICEANIVPLYECYLRCLDDYTVDRRGDVGAWVREAAMSGLEELTTLAAREEAANKNIALVNTKEFTLLPEICVREMMTRLAQQSVEKIDRTRGHAAKIFTSILFDDNNAKAIPRYDEILEIFLPILNHSTKGSSMDFESLMIHDNEKLKKLNQAMASCPSSEDNQNIGDTDPMDSFGWTVESATFPFFIKLLAFEEYRERILLGLIVSVGGLTERLVIHSSQALYGELQNWEGSCHSESKSGQQVKNEANLQIFCDTMLRIFEKYQRVDRVTVPLFKFSERLLISGHLDPILLDQKSNFAFELFSLIKKEVCGGAGLAPCSDPNKIMSAADVLCALLPAEEPLARQKCLVQLSIFLCHKYPRIRKSTATKLFEALQINPQIIEDEIEDKTEEIDNILGQTTWDITPIDQLRPLRNKLCELLGVPPPAVVKKPVL